MADQKEIQNRPEVKEKRNQAIKEALARPEVKENILKARETDQYKEKRKLARELFKQDYERYLESETRRREKLKATLNSDECRQKKSEIGKEIMSRPEVKEKFLALKDTISHKVREARLTFLSDPLNYQKFVDSLNNERTTKKMVDLDGATLEIPKDQVLEKLTLGWTLPFKRVTMTNPSTKEKKEVSCLKGTTQVQNLLTNGWVLGMPPKELAH